MSAERILFALARRIMPANREAWLQAMASELDHLPENERGSFALGCLWSAFIERIKLMDIANSPIRRFAFYGAIAWSLFHVAIFLWAITHGERPSLGRGDTFYLTIYAPIMSANFAITAWLVGSARQWRAWSATASLLVLAFTVLYGLIFAAGDARIMSALSLLVPSLIGVSLAMLVAGVIGTATSVIRRGEA